MDMLLRDVPVLDLETILRQHPQASPVPYFFDAARRQDAQRIAVASGLWRELERALRPGVAIPLVRWSYYRDYRRTGERRVADTPMMERRRLLEQAALALWLEHPQGSLDLLHDILWAYCDDATWVQPPHEGATVDLLAAEVGAALGETVHVFRDRLDPEITDRVVATIFRRVFRPVVDFERPDLWWTERHNWNLVCNGSAVRAALAVMADARPLAHFIHPLIQRMTYALDGFTDDGACVEGPGYWDYGFRHFLLAAHALYAKTGGAVNLMRDPKLERIARYPLAAYLDPPFRAVFGDAAHGYLSAESALLVNQFYPLPELLALCEPDGGGRPRLRGWRELALYGGQVAPAVEGREDAYLPLWGYAKVYAPATGPSVVALAAVAGNNGVNHSHNDVGSFLFYRDGTLYLTDPGAPVYRRDTFSANRYRITLCSARGHSVPVINGRLQEAGSAYYGTLSVEGLNAESAKTIRIDLTHAYPPGTVAACERRLTLNPDGSLEIVDTFRFDKDPTSLEDAFVTFEPVAQVDPTTVVIGDGPIRLTMSVPDAAGELKAEPLPETARETQSGDVLNRITLTPRVLASEVQCRLICRFTRDGREREANRRD